MIVELYFTTMILNKKSNSIKEISFNNIKLNGLMLPAASLFYALLMALLIAIISTALITTAVFYKGTIEQSLTEENILQNAHTGIKLLLAEKESTLFPYKMDLYGTASDSVELAKLSWGLFEIAYSKSFKQNRIKRNEVLKVALLGSRPNGYSTAALYIKESPKPLNICGQTYIKGTAYLPEAGIQVGSVNGQSYSGKQLIYGMQKRSKEQLPKINSTLAFRKLTQFKQEAERSFYELEDSIRQSFADATIVTRDSIVFIDQHFLKGNICVIADSLIYVSKSAQLEDVLLFAPNVVFEDEFQGTIQAFASQSLNTGAGSIFNYPSTLSLARLSENIYGKGIEVGPRTTVNGFVLLRDSLQKNDAPTIVFKEESTINGQVYSDGLVNHNGTINGHISCKGFYVMTNTAYLENYLKDAVINIDARSDFYLNPLIQNQKKNRAIVKWLY